ncbi:MAG: mismatch-specific DNA-glycosylase, partial [Gemmatimonadetes bacterium]|nr:mismatch-specific DNA-glycosylase [Gemmatimonadota bacterium]
AGPGNKFWRTLAKVGLTDRQLDPGEYRDLLDYGIGLTDLVKHQAGNDHAIKFRKADGFQLRATIVLYQPRYLCFNGKRPAQEFLGLSQINFGVQSPRIGRTVLFVAPSTSAAANRSWDLRVWQDLARRVLPSKPPHNQRLDLSGARPVSAHATAGAVATDKELVFVFGEPVARRSTAER